MENYTSYIVAAFTVAVVLLGGVWIQSLLALKSSERKLSQLKEKTGTLEREE